MAVTTVKTVTGRRITLPRMLLALLLLTLGVVGIVRESRKAPDTAPQAVAVSAQAGTTARGPEMLKVQVVGTRHHDPTAFTQGLLLHGGSLFESTGLYGSSTLREVDPATGKVKRQVTVPSQYFAEGLALAGDRLFQITWQEKKAFVYGLTDFKVAGEFPYEGEGWGLCWDGKRLVMSDGSDRLTFRDPKTFAPLGEVRAFRPDRMGEALTNLNELECVDGQVYANVWHSDQILRIDPKDGRVTAVIDASGLLTPEEASHADVLNGIAWDPQRKDFLITGKLWPKLFEVRFVPGGVG